MSDVRSVDKKDFQYGGRDTSKIDGQRGKAKLKAHERIGFRSPAEFGWQIAALLFSGLSFLLGLIALILAVIAYLNVDIQNRELREILADVRELLNEHRSSCF